MTGSFKARGGWAAVSALAPEARARGVLAFSSGNHAQGVAWAAAAHGAPAVILMPSDAPAVKIDGTRGYGAEVVLYDRAREDRDALGARLAAERGLSLIPPFDHPEVIAGQGTLGLEIAAQAAEAGVADAEVLVPLRRRRAECGRGAGAWRRRRRASGCGRRSRRASTIWRGRWRPASGSGTRPRPGRSAMRS